MTWRSSTAPIPAVCFAWRVGTASSWKRKRSSCWGSPTGRKRWPTGGRGEGGGGAAAAKREGGAAHPGAGGRGVLRRGAKARTGKSKARIDNAGRLMRELGDLETR